MSATRMRRVRSSKGIEPISRDMLQNPHLSARARGVLSLLCSLAPTWDCHGVDGITKTFFKKDGLHAITESVKELEAAGYLARLRRRAARGRFDWTWVYSDQASEVESAVAEHLAEGWEIGVSAGRTTLRPSTSGASKSRESSSGQASSRESEGLEVLFSPTEKENETGEVGNETRVRAPAAKPPGVIDAEPVESSQQALIQVSRQPARMKIEDLMVGFEEFYAAYPKRVDRREAERAWVAARRRGASAERVVSAAKRFAEESQYRDRQFIPYPATWLGRESYDNEPEVRRPAQTKAEAKFQRHVQQHHDLFDEDGNFRVDPYSVTADLDHRAIGQ